MGAFSEIDNKGMMAMLDRATKRAYELDYGGSPPSYHYRKGSGEVRATDTPKITTTTWDISEEYKHELMSSTMTGREAFEKEYMQDFKTPSLNKLLGSTTAMTGGYGAGMDSSDILKAMELAARSVGEIKSGYRQPKEVVSDAVELTPELVQALADEAERALSGAERGVW